MAVLVTANQKGGVGKTTITILLTEELAHMGYSVALVETDKVTHAATYLANRAQAERPVNFELYTEQDPGALGATIKRASQEHDIVVVDLPAGEGLLFTRAVARANLVLIPMAPSTFDNTSAAKALSDLAIEEEHLDRPIPHRIVLNMVANAGRREKAVGVSRTERGLRQHIASHGYPKLDAELTRREGPYKDSFSTAMTLREMLETEQPKSLVAAQDEVMALATEVLSVLSGRTTPPPSQEGPST